MTSILQDFEILETVGADLTAFAEGQSVGASKTFGSVTVNVSAVELPNGPVAPYQEFSGSFWQIFGLVFADAGAISAGAPISLAEKVGDKWYGETITVSTGAATAPPPPAAG
jgi:hypothetical protein